MRRYSRLNIALIGLGILFTICVFSVTGCSNAQETPESDSTDVLLPTITEISSSAEVVPTRWLVLSYPNGAGNLEFYFAQGSIVNEGDQIAYSNDLQYEISILQAEAAVKRAQSAYDKALAQPTEPSELAARAALANAEVYLQSRKDIGASTSVIDAAQLDVDSAQANLDSILAGASQDELEALENDLTAAQTALDKARTDPYLIAPFDGTVVQILPNSGEYVSPLEPVIYFADLSDFRIITTDLSEVDVTQLYVGQSAMVVFDALSDQTFDGTIEHIADRSSGVSSVYYEVTIKLLNTPPNLRWGMTAFVIFPLE